MATSIDQQFIEYIVKSLVSNPDDVKIERRIDEKGVLLELSVSPDDLGRVIGKRGATAQSLRTLLRALGTKNDARYNLKIIDTGPPPEDRPRRDDRQDQPPVEEQTSEPTSTDDSVASEDSQPAAPPVDDIDMAEDEELPEAASTDHSDVISKTRQELAELDDLDV
jgi:predicted RNA-binding protein YlqC (UPF0109 family)